MTAEPVRADVTRPQEGDVVIIYTSGHWEVSLASRPAGVSWATCDEALALVRRFAERQHVDVRVSRDGGQSYAAAVRCRKAAKEHLEAYEETRAHPKVVV